MKTIKEILSQPKSEQMLDVLRARTPSSMSLGRMSFVLDRPTLTVLRYVNTHSQVELVGDIITLKEKTQ